MGNAVNQQPIAYLNGQWIPAQNLCVGVENPGFLLGTTVAERLRTFGFRLFALNRHLDRLHRSLDILGLPCPDRAELRKAAEEICEHNGALLAEGDDLGLTIFATPPRDTRSGPTVALHTSPLPFSVWCKKYTAGERLVVSSVRQVPPSCWPPALKCRSRVHYFLADKEARAADPASRALLLDQDGFVSEASTASVLMYCANEGFVAPRPEKILAGVTLATLKSFAADSGIPFVHRDIRPEEMQQADEVLLCSTSPCVLPVVAIDGKLISDGVPGPQFQALIRKFSQLAGLDIVAQAVAFANRRL